MSQTATESLRAPAYHRVRKALLGSRWQEGQFLSPQKIAKEMGISNTPVREAIIQLETEGLVESVPKRGVRPKRLDRQELGEMFEMRMVVEAGAARLAAERINDEQLRDLRRIHKQAKECMREFPDAASTGSGGASRLEYARCNFLFHLGVVAASGNRRLAKTISDLHLLTRLLHTGAVLPGDTVLKEAQRERRFHGGILTALSRHDAGEAARNMREHLKDAMRHHLKVHDWLQEQRSWDSEHNYDWPEDFLEAIRRLEDTVGGFGAASPDD